MQKEPEGDSARVCGVCVRVPWEREAVCVCVGRGGVSVKIISGFSVRMNFTTVSSHEII